MLLEVMCMLVCAHVQYVCMYVCTHTCMAIMNSSRGVYIPPTQLQYRHVKL